jgi:hypothetical protein
MSNDKRPTKKELKSITNKFRQGDYTVVSEKTGFERSYVWRTLNGERFNASIISAAKKLVAKRA